MRPRAPRAADHVHAMRMFTGCGVCIPGWRSPWTLRCLLLLFMFGALTWPLRTPGALATQVEIAHVQGPAWMARGIRVGMDLDDHGALRLKAAIQHIQLPGRLGRLEALTLDCPEAKYKNAQLHCERAHADFTHPGLGTQRIGLAVHLRKQGRSEIRFEALKLGRGRLRGRYGWAQNRWRLTLQGQAVDAARLLALLRTLAPDTPGVTVTGVLDFRLELKGAGAQVSTLSLQAQAWEAGFADTQQKNVGEDLALELRLKAEQAGGGVWRFESDAALRRGALLIDPLYVEAPAVPLTLGVRGRWHSREGRVTLETAHIEHDRALRATFSAGIDLKPAPSLRRLDARIQEARFPGVYATYLAPWLIGTPLEAMRTSGAMRAQVHVEQGRVASLSLHVDDLALEDRRGRFALNGLHADWHWGADTQPVVSELGFSGARVYRLDIGAARARFEGQGRDYRLLAPIELPVLDGRLNIEALSLQETGTQAPSWQLDAGLRPISMERLSEAMGWPSMAGKLTGMIPRVSYAGGRLDLGGALLVQVFDGELTVTRMQVEDLFSRLPRLHADLNFKRLDLDALTRAFSFGYISGRLDGYVRGLEMVAWQPAAFDARFESTPGDRTPRRLSQRAVNSLTRIGGGLTGALSTGFIGMFEEFSYDRVGLACRLEAGICHMGGVQETDKGFYLVKGAGLPRIDILGHNRRVAWDILYERLTDPEIYQRAVIK